MVGGLVFVPGANALHNTGHLLVVRPPWTKRFGWSSETEIDESLDGDLAMGD